MHNMWKRKSIVAGAAALGALVVAAWSVPASQTRADEGSNQILEDVAQISPENFKDAKFREVLTEYDFNSDGYLQDDEIEKITELNLANSGIKDLTGIEYLSALEKLDCSGCEITELELAPSNGFLYELNCSGTKLTTLNLCECPNLQILNCKGTPIEKIYFFSTSSLVKLNCSDCKLTELGIPDFDLLEELICYGNELKELYVSDAESLAYLDCSKNPLETLDVYECPSLTTLNCRETKLKELILGNAEDLQNLEKLYISDNAELETLSCMYTKLQTLSLKGCTKLKTLQLYGSELNGLKLDEQAELVELMIDDSNISSLDLSACTKLEILELCSTPIKSLDFSKNLSLTSVMCYDAKLTSVDVSCLSKLESLDVGENEISKIDVSKNTKLMELYVGANKITSIDVSMLPNLETLSVRDNSIAKLDVSKNRKLTTLNIGGTTITEIDLSENRAIENLWIEDTGISDLDLSYFSNLVDLDVSRTKIKSLDFCQNKNLEVVACVDSEIYSLALNFTPKLVCVDVAGTKINYLNIYGCTALENLVDNHEPKLQDGKYYYYESQEEDGYFFLRFNKDVTLTRQPYTKPTPLPPITIPDLVGMKCNEAKKKLTQELKWHGFCYVEITVELDKGTDASKELYVIGQTPEAGKVFYGNHSRFSATLLVSNEAPETTPPPTPTPGGTTPTPPTPTPPTPTPGDTTPTPPTPTPVTPTTVPTPTPNDPTFEDFVERLYTVALNRPSEKEGKDFWVKQVVEEGKTGADCARFFLLDADEFMKRNLSVEDFVETLYKTFFDRESDEEGKLNWVDAINSGRMTRAVVVNNFIESTEWCNVCATYGVKSGSKYYKATKASKNAINFATRLYTCCLKREAEEGGLTYWSLALTNLEKTGAQAAQFFFEGEEFVGFNTTDEDYITRLYTTFMDREPAASEVNYWIGEIKAGRQTRKSVISFFAQSPEFTSICKQYGIDRGTI